jgi:hypothetical protein
MNEGLSCVPLTTFSYVPKQDSGGRVDARGDEEPDAGEVVDALLASIAASWEASSPRWDDEPVAPTWALSVER